MSSSLLYEVHTRRWLRALSEGEGRNVSLAGVPASTFSRWKELGVTHLWLMGVWSVGPKSRDAYLRLPETASRLDSVLPNWTLEDISASPYAIREYTVADEFGGDHGLAAFRRGLHQHGIQLILDFVPNHVGLDHPWLETNPHRFVQNHASRDGFFLNEPSKDPAWIAHGKDPYFPPWHDTAQLDLRLEDTQSALIEELESIAARCDGVRCDMAMLALREVFAAHWRLQPPRGSTTDAEFWARAIQSVQRPGFTFIAEAYWDLESRLLDLGFDYVYAKRLTDYLAHHQWNELESYLAACPNELLQHSVHFLENHDEPRAADRFTASRHALAAFLITALPGMCLIYDGQLEGSRLHSPVQLSRKPTESLEPVIATMYQQLFALWKLARVSMTPRKVLSVSPVIAISWETSAARTVLAVVNGRTTAETINLLFPALQCRDKLECRSLRHGIPQIAATELRQDGKLMVRMPAESFDLLEVKRAR